MTSAIAEAAVFIGQSFMLSVVLKATILLILGLIAVRMGERSRASLRYAILAATFGSLVMLPLIQASDRRFSITVPASDQSEPQSAKFFISTATEDIRTGWNGAETTGSRVLSMQTRIQLIWIAGVLVSLLPLAVNLSRLRRIRRDGLPCPELRERVASAAAEYGIRPIDILFHEATQAPFLFGFRRPAIVLPSDARGWNDGELRCAVVHELEHVRRGDWAAQLIVRLICACYWFHPLVWVAWRRLCLEAERTCDDAVIQTEEHTNYAEQLVSLARRMSKAHAHPALGMASRSDLSRRVTALLDSTQHRGRAGVAAVASIMIVAAIVVFAVAPLHAVAQTPQNQQSESSSKQTTARRPGVLDRALYEASEGGEVSDIEQLLNAGANVNCALQGDGSPLIGAAREGHSAAIRLLLDRGADPNMPVSGDGNPLIMAAREGHSEVVALLLDRGARIDEVVQGDENALIQASGSGKLSVVKLLVSRGANVNARVLAERNFPREGEWRSPLSMARNGGHAEVAAYLTSVGARE